MGNQKNKETNDDGNHEAYICAMCFLFGYVCFSW